MSNFDLKIVQIHKQEFKNLQNSQLVLEISGDNSNYTLVNTLRRLALDYIPTYAFPKETILIEKNNSIFDNDYMSLRLSQMTPLKIKLFYLVMFFFVSQPALAQFGNCDNNSHFNVGAGIYDITGPAAEQGMMGYGMLNQRTAGISQRLWARAFVIESPCNGKRVVFVNTDLGMMFQGIKQDVIKKLGRHPTAEFLIHPECGCVSDCMHYVATKAIPEERTHILSTSGMLKYAKESNKDKFIVATETGILHRLKKENPKKKFLPLRKDMVCEYMKMITLSKLLNSLVNLEFEVKVPKDIAERARIPIERMLAIG